VVVLPAPSTRHGKAKPVEQRIETAVGTLVVRIEEQELTVVRTKAATGWSLEVIQAAPGKVVVRCTSARATHQITLVLGADGRTTVQWTIAGGGSNRRG
jgi:hypothetical protein